MVYIESFLLAVIVFFLLYKWSTSKYNQLRDRGVPHDKPYPLIGNMNLRLFFGKSSFLQETLNNYNKFKDYKVYGTYSMRDPIIVVRDVELIKKIAIKDFDNFPNHRSIFTDLEENIFSKSLIALRDRKWKEMRNRLTPSFTGSKMRLMFELINECSKEGVKYIEEELKATENNELELEMKDFFTRFANDVIASAAFGIKLNSFVDKKNNFYTTGTTLTQLKGIVVVKAILFGLIPKIMKFLRVKLMDEKTMKYFYSLVFDAIEYRKENNIIRPDMIQLLMEAKRNFELTKSDPNSKHTEFSDDDLIAQCFLFFFAGFETVSTCLCFTTYEILKNQDVQQRLYEEILEMEKELNGEPLNYDALMKMKYLDMVLSESLRMWPPAIMTDRSCAADYKLIDDDGKLHATIKKDDLVFIPIIALHYDPEHFENPHKFDPERFSDENKANINPATYMPFGVGPRNCIGNRLALMETKSIIYHTLLNFKLTSAKKTAVNMLESLDSFRMQPKELFWTKFTPRTQ